MNTDYIILDLEWDHQKIKYDNGKKAKLIRGVDYDLDWQKIGGPFAKNKKAIFRYLDFCYEKHYKVIDIPSFELIHESSGTYYFKDKNNVYLDSYMNYFSILENANPADFKILDIKKGYASSGNTDYYFNQKIPFRLKDATIFDGEVYQKVGNDIYFGFQEKMDCDAKTFELVDNRQWYKTVFKDKNHVYFRGRKIENADAETFHFLENCINEEKRPRYVDSDIHYYAKDKHFAYFIDGGFKIKQIKTKDIEGFDFKVIDSEGYAFDKDHIYHRGVRKKKE